MKKLFLSLCVVVCALIAFNFLLDKIDSKYERKVTEKYYDSIGNLYGESSKDSGMILQKKSLEKKDSLLIFGSSELGSNVPNFYPAYFFENKSGGFQINLIGRGHSQSLIHAINFLALDKDLKGKKAVFIISPQWFSSGGLDVESFKMNFSELQFYSFMFDNSVDKELKMMIAKRINSILQGSQELVQIKTFCSLYVNDNTASSTILTTLSPYYKMKFKILSVKDKIKAYKLLSDKKENLEIKKSSKEKNFIWNEEKELALSVAKSEANNNDFGIENNYFNSYIKDNLNKYKGYDKNSSYLSSPEYEDLSLLLEVCKSRRIEPLFISVPVHGKWYDYCEFNKEDRNQYYSKINSLISSYGFQISDFSKYEYEDFFLKDVMHLGWKGWVYVNEAIYEYYHQK